jgi:sensor histidine kinase YesM
MNTLAASSKPPGEGLPVRLRAARARLPYALALLALVVALMTVFEVAGILHLPDAHTDNFLAFLALTIGDELVSYGPVVLTMVVVGELVPQRSERVRLAWLGPAVALTALACAALQHSVDPAEAWNRRTVVSDWLATLFPIMLLLAIYEFHRQDVQAVEEALALRVARAALDAEQNKARLLALRAQIEPHFLFNTLANVRRLYWLDTQAGAAMLASLIHYIGTALPRMRCERTRLRDEAELIRAYLDLYRIRMGARLRYEIAFPDALLELRVPSLMLLTLIENALKHGLAPLPEGGALRVSAETQGGLLRLCVADSGLGLSRGSGHGTGLANIRARLVRLYGDAAKLSLSRNQPRGVVATLSLPL